MTVRLKCTFIILLIYLTKSCTYSCLRYLCFSKIWCGDGTFSIAPQHFYQLYTIHGIVMGQLVPLMYCLLSKKTKANLAMYRKLFEQIKYIAENKSIELEVKCYLAILRMHALRLSLMFSQMLPLNDDFFI